ncbi:MAG TPA: hypothetical protein VNN76_07785 [Bacteroidota bacterium]|nr:hypothetical protein [Bacteroidota bacterium]
MKYLSIALVITTSASAQLLRSYRVDGSSLPSSNAIFDIHRKTDTLWFGTNKGLDRTLDYGLSWTQFRNTQSFDDKGISAIGQFGSLLAVATAYSFSREGEAITAGGGIHVSTDHGTTWRHVPQPRDVGSVDTILYGNNRIRSLAITTEANNVTYDIAITPSAVWIASFAGMLRKSTDRGLTWQKVVLPPDELQSIRPEDTLNFDLSPVSGGIGLRGNLNHRVFSVFAQNDSIIYVGTAGGINKTTDRGRSWTKFTTKTQPSGLSGNFVVALREQVLPTSRVLWASTVNAEDPAETRGVSFTDDGGVTWKTTLRGQFAHNFAFKDSVVYVATDEGVFRSSNFGQSWQRSGTIYDISSLQRFVSTQIFAVEVVGDTLWVGGPEGIATTIDSPASPFGSTWRIFRTYRPVGVSSATYAYPTPFSPDDEPVRIHFSTEGRDATVTIRIFDFGMKPVRVLLRSAQRSGQREHDEIWDGRDDDGNRVANGLYFYRIELDGKEPRWGKIHVLQ